MIIKFSNFSKNHLIFSEKIRYDFEKRNYSGQDLIHSAKNLIAVHLIGTLNNDLIGRKIYNKLIKLGYSTDEIIISMATAWLKDADYFELRDLDKKIWKNNFFRNIILPLMLSISTASLILFYFYRKSPEILIDIIVAPPLVAIFCGILFVFFYKIFGKNFD